MGPEATRTRWDKIGGAIGEIFFAPLRLIFALLCMAVPLVLANEHGPAWALLAIPALPAVLTCLWMPETGSKLWRLYGRSIRKAFLKIPAPARERGDRAIKSASSAVDTSANIVGAFGVELVRWIFLAALFVLGVGLMAGAGYAIFQGIAELPISVAIVLGAMIIAWAVAKR